MNKFWCGKVWAVTNIYKDMIHVQHNQENNVCNKRCLVKLKGE